VRLGIEHGSGNSGSSDKEDRSSDNDGNSPCWEERSNMKGSLLISVGEVVVSGVHVIVVTSYIGFNETSIEVVRGSIELHAISNVLLGSILVIVVSSQELSLVEATNLVEHGHSDSESWVSEEDLSRVGSDPSISNWIGGRFLRNLNKVRSISSISSFSCISSWVGITTGPLEVDVISDSGVEILGNKIVLSCRVGLDNISSLSTDVQVEDSGNRADSRGS